jgi:hypothetical protein
MVANGDTACLLQDHRTKPLDWEAEWSQTALWLPLPF